MLAYPLPGTFLLLVSQWWSRVGTIDRGGDARMTVDPAPPPFPRHSDSKPKGCHLRPWRQIAEQACQEQDGERLLLLCRELEKALEEQLEKAKPVKVVHLPSKTQRPA